MPAGISIPHAPVQSKTLALLGNIALHSHPNALAAVRAPPKILQGQRVAINTYLPLGQTY